MGTTMVIVHLELSHTAMSPNPEESLHDVQAIIQEESHLSLVGP